MRLSRRHFLSHASIGAGSIALAGSFRSFAWEMKTASPFPWKFPDEDPRWSSTAEAAVAALSRNIRRLGHLRNSVLIEGSAYGGVWLECAPQEGLVCSSLGLQHSRLSVALARAAARENHMVFFALQRADGQLPAYVIGEHIGFGQIQMVVPIAATAWELAQQTGDDELLRTAYAACGRWDAWLRKYRNTRGTGLVEGFCTFDTGMDNSPRWSGIPDACPEQDARKCPPVSSLPRLCPDLSATVYGGRVALAAMAVGLGKRNDAAHWLADAETLRRLILERLYDERDGAFYDVDAQDNFVRVRCDVMTRVLGEHVLKLSELRDRAIFDAVWTRQLHNSKAFWATYPFPSIAQDDPKFVRPIPANSWGGASQALTALRAPRWMPHYGKNAELRHLMHQWCVAMMRHTEFYQQVDPQTGGFTKPDPGGYSPAALAFLDFTRRLATRDTPQPD